MFAIVGSGFGLYGYLPAILESGPGPVLLPRAYEPRVRARRELAPYVDSIRWADDEAMALALADAVVIAVPPLRQEETVRRCLSMPNIGRLVMEKPVAVDPQRAARLLEGIEAAGRSYRIGYSLLHTAWAKGLAWPTAYTQLRWTFMAHHFAHDLHNWKREERQGGGVLRFFGVHLFALLARHGYDSVVRSSLEGKSGEPERWTASFAGAGRGNCDVEVDSRAAATTFRISAAGRDVVALDEPFAHEVVSDRGHGDRRIGVLQALLATFDEPDAAWQGLYRAANGLWRDAERIAAAAAR
jgi:predicted dehydrogenase